MTNHNPIAYTYEADHHCPDCTEKRFGRNERGFIAEDAEDSAGNPVGAIFDWDEWWNTEYECETLTCGDCLEVIESLHCIPCIVGDVDCTFTSEMEIP